MPLTKKGEKIERAMKQEYGAKAGERVFYASRNAGKISGVDGTRGRDMLERAIKAGNVEAEAQRQARALLNGDCVSGRDRAKLMRGRR